MSIKKYLLFALLLAFSTATSSFSQLTIHPDDRNLYIQKANTFFAENKWEQGKETVDEGLKKYSKDSDLRGLNGKYYLHLKEYETARYELKKALEYNTKNVSAKHTLINVEMATKRYSSAISYVNELLESFPYDKYLWLKKAEAYRLQGNIVESNRLLKRIRHIYPEDRTLKENMLDYLSEEFHSKKGSAPIGEIEELALSILSEDPRNEEILIGLINSCIQVGNYDKALHYAEMGVQKIPGSMALIKKRNSILAHQNRYPEILSLMKEHTRRQGNTTALSRENDYYMQEAVRHAKEADSYHIYQSLFRKQPKSVDYFNRVYTLALSRALYDDAIEAIKSAKKARGEAKDILLKERYLYERMGNQSKQRQIVRRIAELYPDDEDIKYEKSVWAYTEAKGLMADRMFSQAAPLLDYVIENGDEDFRKLALVSQYSCYVELNNAEGAESVVNQLIEREPQEADWRFKKSLALGMQRKHSEALEEYEEGLKMAEQTGNNIEGFRIGYEEQATLYTKELIEAYRFEEAIALIDRWLTVAPGSERAVRYGYNVAYRMNDAEKMKEYVAIGMSQHPQEWHYQLKLADVYIQEENYGLAADVLVPILRQRPYHKEAIAVHSQLRLAQAKLLLKETDGNPALEVLNEALVYDPKNTDILYLKGVAFEKLHVADSALYYQSFYTPSPAEWEEHKRNLLYLAYIKKKNEASFLVQLYRFADEDKITTITEAKYARMEKNNTYIGRFFYSGRDNGKSVMFRGEWDHRFSPEWSTSVSAAMGTKVFPRFVFSPTVYYAFAPTWEAELTAGFRRLSSLQKMFNQQVGLSKELYFARFTGKFNSVILDKKWYYNLFGQTRFFIRERRNYVTAMGSLGSAPDIDVIDNRFYHAFNVTNSMVALGGHFILSESCSIDPLGACYNYKVGKGVYKNILSLQLRVNIRF